MSMLRRRLLSLIVVFVVSTVIVVWLVARDSELEERARQAKIEGRLLAIDDPSDVVQLRIENSEGVFKLERRNGTWFLAEPRELLADPEVVAGMILFFAKLKEGTEVGEKRGDTVVPPSDLALFGLAEPRYVLGLGLADGSTRKLEVGKKSRFDSSAYVRRGGEDAVYTTDGGIHFQLDKGVYDLRDKRLTTFEPQSVASYTQDFRVIGGPDLHFRVERSPTGWRAVEPAAFPLNERQIDEMLAALASARAARFVTEDPDEAAFETVGLDEPDVTLTLRGTDGRQETLRFLTKTEPTRYLVGIEGMAIVELLSPATHRRVKFTPPQLRDLRIIPVEAGDFASISLQGPSSGVSLTRDDGSWRVSRIAPLIVQEPSPDAMEGANELKNLGNVTENVTEQEPSRASGDRASGKEQEPSRASGDRASGKQQELSQDVDQAAISGLIYNLSRLEEGPQSSDKPSRELFRVAGLDRPHRRITVKSRVDGEKYVFYVSEVVDGTQYGRLEGSDRLYVFDASKLGTVSALPSDYVVRAR